MKTGRDDPATAVRPPSSQPRSIVAARIAARRREKLAELARLRCAALNLRAPEIAVCCRLAFRLFDAGASAANAAAAMRRTAEQIAREISP
jgi:hypothetical protein